MGSSQVVEELEVALLCKQFQCLPSSLEQEDLATIHRIREVYFVLDTFDLLGSQGGISKLGKAQWELVKQVRQLREEHPEWMKKKSD